MSATGLLQLMVARLEATGIPFMLTGSLAAAVHGAGRATMDIDVVIEPSREQLRHLVQSLSVPGLYVSESAAAEAFAHEGMFNVVESSTGWKVDLIIRKSRPFSLSEFCRRERLDVDGMPLWVTSREDLIIAKLEWNKAGGSARQLEDVASLLRIGAGVVDLRYVERWVGELGLQVQWDAVRGPA